MVFVGFLTKKQSLLVQNIQHYFGFLETAKIRASESSYFFKKWKTEEFEKSGEPNSTITSYSGTKVPSLKWTTLFFC